MTTTPATVRIIFDEHAALAAMLVSLRTLAERGPGDRPAMFFDVLRAMLFYIDEFPERRHHPKESDLLFPRVARRAPQTLAAIARLEQDHLQGEARVRELQHLLLAWELLGESRRPAFAEAAGHYVAFYLEHMRLEEREILPQAQAALTAADWAELDAAFGAHRDPLAGGQPPDALYDRLFTRIVMTAPEPLGLGDAGGMARAGAQPAQASAG
ncbi:hemerythrin domain-containing protein [Variovorax terrae]|uniref:Hemerythrin domain-containing protein n=1 Tax=Variovorax terrae TaxID=2923278 RepID=A0A9X1W0V6_9BURK|nr:hemerythrin domain-containing protein [Variovorax terrae]MCJ0765632.1 hemerythrin domain-containing protein [Variovorax terrae]